jgi:hypothetical protein
VKVLFFMPGPGYLRHYESALRLLARRGVNVHLAFDGNEPDVDTGQKLRDDLVREFANVTFEAVPEIKLGAWGFLAKAARLFQDYLRYSNPVFDKAPILKDRMWGKTPPTLLAVFEFLARKCRLGARILGPALRLLDWMVPVDRRITAWIAEKSPELVLITPLVYFGSAQVDYVKVARRLGVRSALCVASWDNLTNKGLIRIMPDKIFVWNDAQKSEAVTLHGARADCVETTGAQTFDEWFVARPKLSREYFFRTVGLDPVHPYLLYLCSSKSIAPNEVMFIEKWIHALRSSAFPELRKAGILVRPHPKNLEQWTYPDVLQAENVAVWPRTITDWVIDDEKRADYFHSLYFSRAVVGVNTSALIEAGIVGRAVYTVLAPEFSRTQQGTLHFHYLKDFSGGLLRVARNFDEHREHLAAALAGSADEQGRCETFTRTFVRPHGLDVPAAGVLADKIESLASATKPRPSIRAALLPAIGRILLYPAAFFARTLMLNPEKRARIGFIGALLPDVQSPLMSALIWVHGRLYLASVMFSLVWAPHIRLRLGMGPKS